MFDPEGTNTEAAVKIDEQRLDAWLQEVRAIRKGRGIHPGGEAGGRVGSVAKSVQLRLSERYAGGRQFLQDRSIKQPVHMKYD